MCGAELAGKDASRAGCVDLIDFIRRDVSAPNQNGYRLQPRRGTHLGNKARGLQNRQSERDDDNVGKFGFRELPQSLQSDCSRFYLLNRRRPVRSQQLAPSA